MISYKKFIHTMKVEKDKKMKNLTIMRNIKHKNNDKIEIQTIKEKENRNVKNTVVETTMKAIKHKPQAITYLKQTVKHQP